MLQFDDKVVDLFFRPSFKIEDMESLLENLTREKTQLTSVTRSRIISLEEKTGEITISKEDGEIKVASDKDDDETEDDNQIALNEVDSGIELEGAAFREEEKEGEEETSETQDNLDFDDNSIELGDVGDFEFSEEEEDKEEDEGEFAPGSTFVRKLSAIEDEVSDDDKVIDLGKELEGVDDILGVTGLSGDNDITAVSYTHLTLPTILLV